MSDIDQQVLTTIQHGMAEITRMERPSRWQYGVTPFYVATMLGMKRGDVLASMERLAQRGEIVNATVGFLGYGWVQPVARQTFRRINV